MKAERLEGERLRALITRNLGECCEDCRALLREQLKREERCQRSSPIPPQDHCHGLEGQTRRLIRGGSAR